MMRDINYDFILTGCHPFSTIAACYFPSVYISSSSRSLRRYIRSHQALLTDMLAAEYDEQDKTLTPTQIAIIVEHMGMPGRVGMDVRAKGTK